MLNIKILDGTLGRSGGQGIAGGGHGVGLGVLYKIPYRRAPRLAYRLHMPLSRVCRASKGILQVAYKTWSSDYSCGIC